MNKKIWLDICEIIDTFRLVPRIIILGYAAMCYDVYQYAKLTGETANWLFTAVFAVAGAVTAWYFNTGRKWVK